MRDLQRDGRGIMIVLVIIVLVAALVAASVVFIINSDDEDSSSTNTSPSTSSPSSSGRSLSLEERNDIARIQGLVVEAATNNNGRLPTSLDQIDLSELNYYTEANIRLVDYSASIDASDGEMVIVTGAECSSDGSQLVAAPRSFAVLAGSGSMQSCSSS